MNPLLLARSMTRRAHKIGVFTVEGLHALSLAFYFLFLFFFMQARFGFGNMENLLLGGFGGFLYMSASFLCGKTSRRLGLYNCLTGAFVVMAIALLIGSRLETLVGHLIVFSICVLSMGFVWAPLQVLCCEGEPPVRVQRMVGIYNVVWATVVAGGYFVAGAMFEAWELSIFIVPAGISVLQLLIVLTIRRPIVGDAVGENLELPRVTASPEPVPPGIARAFLRMAWLANPFAFVAVNVCTPTIPTIADRFELTPTYAGIFCSVWLFGRAAGFVICWNWAGWHYRLGWLVFGYLVMVVSFGTILLVPSFAVLLAAQAAFGLSLGLLYYSSLYYSMHVDLESRGEHGGTHEASIGAGNCAGPLCGAAALYLFPNHPHAGVWTVSVALVIGFAWVGRVWLKREAKTGLAGSSLH